MEEVVEVSLIAANITPIAILSSSMLAATFAFMSIRSSRSIARKKNSIDLVFEYNNEDSVQEGLSEIRRIHNCPDTNIEKYGYENNKEPERTTQLNQALNYFEFVSVGVKEGIYDENILKRSIFSSFTNCYDHTLPYIEKIRERYSRPTIFQDFEYLALKWKKTPLKRLKKK